MDKEGEVTRDAPLPVFGEHLAALLNPDGLSGGEVADTEALINGAPEAEVGRSEDDAPPLVFGEHLAALLKSDGLGSSEVADTGGLINSTPETEVGRAQDVAPPGTRDTPPLVIGEGGVYLVALLNSDGLGGGEVADTRGLINGTPEAEDVAPPGTRDAPPLVIGEHGMYLVALLTSDVFGSGEALLDDAPEDEDDQAQQAQQGGWIRGACLVILCAADAASCLLRSIASEAVIHNVLVFLPGSGKLIVALAAVAFLIAHLAAGHHGVFAHQEPPPCGWIHGARFFLSVAPAAAYLAAATFPDNVPFILVTIFGDLANAVASLVFAIAVAAFVFLPRSRH